MTTHMHSELSTLKLMALIGIKCVDILQHTQISECNVTIPPATSVCMYQINIIHADNPKHM